MEPALCDFSTKIPLPESAKAEVGATKPSRIPSTPHNVDSCAVHGLSASGSGSESKFHDADSDPDSDADPELIW
jgi:hypothetical protein